MSDTTTANILAKGTNATGITEALAQKLHDNLGKKIVAVVEIASESRTENSDGDQKVSLKILTLEPAPNTDTENHLRELARSFHYERKLSEDGPQMQIPGDPVEPKVADVLEAGRRHAPHDFTPAPEDETICDVCGGTRGAPIHQDTPDEAEDEPDEPLPAGDDETDDEPDAA